MKLTIGIKFNSESVSVFAYAGCSLFEATEEGCIDFKAVEPFLVPSSMQYFVECMGPLSQTRLLIQYSLVLLMTIQCDFITSVDMAFLSSL